MAGANPIIVPSNTSRSPHPYGGDASPTGVADPVAYEAPAWYSKGSDLDDLLNETDALDWLADTGDLDQTYNVPAITQERDPLMPSLCDHPIAVIPNQNSTSNFRITSTNSNPNIPESVPMPPLPSLFESHDSHIVPLNNKVGASDQSMPFSYGLAPESSDASTNCVVFDSHCDEQAFVSTLLDTDSNDFFASQ